MVPFRFFTFWVLTLHALHASKRLSRKWDPDLWCMTLLVSVTGLYLTYVHPREISYAGVTCRGVWLKWLDFLLHQYPLMRLVNLRFGLSSYWRTYVMTTLYIALFDTRAVYQLRQRRAFLTFLGVVWASKASQAINKWRKTRSRARPSSSSHETTKPSRTS